MSQPSTQSQPPTTLDFTKMTKLQKLAALLIMLGRENAAEILKSLDDQEVEAISVEMAGLPLITMDIQERVLAEFTEVAILASTSAHAASSSCKPSFRRLWEISKPPTSSTVSRPTALRFSTIQQIVNMDPRQVFNLLRNEHPQMIAVVASYMAPEKASHVMASLPPNCASRSSNGWPPAPPRRSR